MDFGLSPRPPNQLVQDGDTRQNSKVSREVAVKYIIIKKSAIQLIFSLLRDVFLSCAAVR